VQSPLLVLDRAEEVETILAVRIEIEHCASSIAENSSLIEDAARRPDLIEASAD
jgi:hypothetical protein